MTRILDGIGDISSGGKRPGELLAISNERSIQHKPLEFRNKSKPPAAHNYKLLRTPHGDTTSDHMTSNDNVPQIAFHE